LPEHRPVKHVVVIVVQRAEKYSEELAQVHVVRGLVEAQPAAVVQIHDKLGRVTLAQDVDRRRHLLLADTVIFLLLRRRLEALPRQRTAVEIHQDMSHGLQVVASALFDAQVSIDACITASHIYTQQKFKQVQRILNYVEYDVNVFHKFAGLPLILRSGLLVIANFRFLPPSPIIII